jgi:hypothetical protein
VATNGIIRAITMGNSGIEGDGFVLLTPGVVEMVVGAIKGWLSMAVPKTTMPDSSIPFSEVENGRVLVIS